MQDVRHVERVCYDIHVSGGCVVRACSMASWHRTRLASVAASEGSKVRATASSRSNTEIQHKIMCNDEQMTGTTRNRHTNG